MLRRYCQNIIAALAYVFYPGRASGALSIKFAGENARWLPNRVNFDVGRSSWAPVRRNPLGCPGPLGARLASGCHSGVKFQAYAHAVFALGWVGWQPAGKLHGCSRRSSPGPRDVSCDLRPGTHREQQLLPYGRTVCWGWSPFFFLRGLQHEIQTDGRSLYDTFGFKRDLSSHTQVRYSRHYDALTMIGLYTMLQAIRHLCAACRLRFYI